MIHLATAAFSVVAMSHTTRMASAHRGCGSDDPNITFLSKKAFEDRIKSPEPRMLESLRRTARQGTTYTPLVIRYETSYLNDQTKYCQAVGNPAAGVFGGQCSEAGHVFTTDNRNFLTNNILPGSQIMVAAALSVSDQPTTLHPGSSCNSLDVSTTLQNGITDRFLLLVTAGPTGGNTLAWATACDFLPAPSSRPFMGHANFCPRFLSEGELEVNTGVHEIFHALGFSGWYFDIHSMRAQFNFRGVTKQGLTGANVLQKYREYFDCATLNPNAVELEDGGGSGSSGSHFDGRTLRQDFMAASDSLDHGFLSEITLAVFADMPNGIYQVNYSAAGHNEWARGAGCDFLTKQCSELPEYFCNAATFPNRGCTYDYEGQGFCRQGLKFMDGCDLPTPWSNTWCTNPAHARGDANMGNSRGENSRCVETENVVEHWINNWDPGYDTRCFETRCMADGTTVQMKIMGSDWFDCPDGQRVEVGQYNNGYKNRVICPNYADFCRHRGCEAGMQSVDGNRCTVCGPGKYAPAGIGHECELCQQGTWSDVERAATCAGSCAPGTSSPEGSISAAACTSVVTCNVGTKPDGGGGCTGCGVQNIDQYQQVANIAIPTCGVSTCQPGYAPNGDNSACDPVVCNVGTKPDGGSGCTGCGVQNIDQYQQVANIAIPTCGVSTCQPGWKPSNDRSDCEECLVNEINEYQVVTGITNPTCGVLSCNTPWEPNTDRSACVQTTGGNTQGGNGEGSVTDENATVTDENATADEDNTLWYIIAGAAAGCLLCTALITFFVVRKKRSGSAKSEFEEADSVSAVGGLRVEQPDERVEQTKEQDDDLLDISSADSPPLPAPVVEPPMPPPSKKRHIFKRKGKKGKKKNVETVPVEPQPPTREPGDSDLDGLLHSDGPSPGKKKVGEASGSNSDLDGVDVTAVDIEDL